MIRVGIVDDHAPSRATLRALLARYSQENSALFAITEFTDGADLIASYRPEFDILLLDVEMPLVDGFDAAHRVREVDPKVIIIFVTNLAQFAIKGYEVAAQSYLVKPVRYFAFAGEISRALSRIRESAPKVVVVNVGGTLTRMDTSQIVYVESAKHRITFHLFDGEFSFSSTLKSVEELLDGKGFYRSNNCYLVNMSHVESVEQTACTMADGSVLAVSRPRRKGFLDALTDHLGGATGT
ncbi:MAG: LytR/AlgR family response regulator transcription factor [Propioniciclava sp.]